MALYDTYPGGTNPNPPIIQGDKFMITAEGGYAIKLTNKTGNDSVKGYLLDTHHSVDNAVALVGLNMPDCIGVFYESGIADGSEAWVVVAGIADVYYIGSTTNGHYARMSRDDGGESGVIGQAISEAIPSTPFATDKHFQEIGHVLEARTGAGLAKTVLHFN